MQCLDVVPDIQFLKTKMTTTTIGDLSYGQQDLEKRVLSHQNAILSHSETLDNDIESFIAIIKNTFPIVGDYPMDISNMQMSEIAADTVFSNDGIVKVVERPMTKTFKDLDNIFTNGKEADIKMYLEKPFLLASGNLATTDGPTSLPTWTWGNALLVSPMYSKHIAGIRSIRADLKLRFSVNANITQTGRYILAWCPYGGLNPSDLATTRWLLAHRFGKAQITQLHHVELDISCDTEVELIIPWSNAFNSFDITAAGAGAREPGAFFLYPYNPVVAPTGSASAGYSLWISYTNVTLGARSYPQMGKKRSVDITQTEAEGGNVSKSLALVSQSAMLLKGVPLLGSLSGPTALVADAFSNIAKLWGFSKPQDAEVAKLITKTLYTGSANIDGAEIGEVLALSKSNHVSVESSLYGTDLDEMSFAFVCSRPTWIQTPGWNTSQGTNTVLFSRRVGPAVETGFGGSLSNDGLVVVTNFTGFGMLSRFFAYWNAEFILTFKFVRTQFHSGRLLFTYEPQFNSSAASSSTADSSSYLMRTIIDVREHNEIEIKIPFIYSSSWSDCDGSRNDIGKVTLSVLDPLVAASNVSTTVNILTEVRTEVVKFSGPRQNPFGPVYASAYQSGCSLGSLEVGDGTSTPNDYLLESMTSGEVIQSFRQLVKRYGLLCSTPAISATTTCTVLPFATYVAQSTGVGVVPTIPSPLPTRDLFSTLSFLYANSRGGVRLMVLHKGFGSSGMVANWVDHVSTNAGALASCVTVVTESETNSLEFRGMLGPVINNNAAPTTIMIPQNTSRYSRSNGANLIASDQTYDYSNDADSAQLIIRGYGTVTTGYIFRAGADDCSFGNFCSIPPMTTFY